MQYKNKILPIMIAVTVIGTSGLVIGSTKAQAQTAQMTDPFSSIVQKLADKFGLNKDQVQVVFDEAHQEFQSQRQAEYEQKLNELVSAGSITQHQKDLILAKHKEIQASHQSLRNQFQDKTPEERHALMENQHLAFETWAQENGIDPTLLRFGLRGPGHGMKFIQSFDLPSSN